MQSTQLGSKFVPRVRLVVPISTSWTTLGTGGGVETFLAMFLHRAERMGLDVTVLCSGPAEGHQGSVHFVPVTAHATGELDFTLRLRRALRRGRVAMPTGSVVLANEEHYAWAFRDTKVPVVLMSHGVIPETLRMRHNALFVRLYRFLIERHAVTHASRVVAVNAQVKQYYLSRYPHQDPRKFAEITVGLNLDDLDGRPQANPTERLALPFGGDLVLFVGRLYPEKNVSLFIAACDILRERGLVFNALVVGDGIEAGILRGALRGRPWLQWTARLTRSDVLDVMAVARVLVICSSYESGPLVLMEAIGLGLPVVSTPVGRAPELVNGYLGRIVGRDPASVAGGIQTVLAWSAKDVRRASEEAKPKIDFRNTMDSLVELLGQVGSH